jgi:hypothetical protein
MENTQQEYYRKIRYLEVASKVLIVFFCAVMFYISAFSFDYEFVSFGEPINSYIWFSLLAMAVFLETIALLFRKKHHLLIKKPIKDFLKFLLFFLIFSSLLSMLFYSPCGSRTKARDARRMADIRQIGDVCELYYSDIDNKYPVYTDFAALKEGGIGDYMKVDDMGSSVPDDPREGDVHYIWIDNTGKGEDQHFCVYAKLETWSADTWVVVSEKGVNNDATREPTGLGDACW